MNLLEILTPSVVKVGMESTNKEEAFEELIDLLVKTGQVTDRERALQAICTREEMRSTGIGKGVAIPHGKDLSIQHITAAAGTSKRGIEFDSIDGKPVHLVFLVLAEANNPGPHLQTLSEIATCLNVAGVYNRLVGARSPEEFLQSLQIPETEVF